MFQIITIIIMIISIIVSLITHPAWGWFPIGFIEFIICIQLWAVKQKYRFDYVPYLSIEANELLKRYGHYFARPLAAKDFSASAATGQFGGIALAIIGIFKSYWWGIVFAGANWCLMGVVAVSFSPVSILAKNPTLKIAHDEIVEFLKLEQQTMIGET